MINKHIEKLNISKVETKLNLLGLFVILAVLKLTGLITMSWWLVTMPLWFGYVLGLAILAILIVIYMLIIIFQFLFGR